MSDRQTTVPDTFSDHVAEYIRTIAFCRHCIVHNDGKVAESRFKKLSEDQRIIVRMHMKNTVHGNDIMLLPSSKQVDELFECLMGYGWAFYILLAERCKMRDETSFFRNPATGKRIFNPK